jgi:ferric-dicitrate binding protein FerR (iron transport regulator)
MAGIGKTPEHYQVEDFVTDESFINYFFHLNTEDVLFWEKWLLANPACKESVDAAREMLRTLTLTLTDEEIIHETAKIKNAIGYDTPFPLRKRPAIVRLLSFRQKRRRALVLPLLLVILAGGYFFTRTMLHPEQVIEKSNTSTDPIVFSLADGTTVTLAPQSVLRYAARFGEKERKVFLTGGAEFDVSRATDHPFEVQDDDIIATVLGTIFSVKKLSGDSVMVVELIKGKLKVENTSSTGQPLTSIILNPDERVVYNRHNQRLYKERWQPQAEFPIQVGHIQFQRNNFDEIAGKIKAVFGVTVINKSKKRNWMFSGEFENATAQDIMKNICVVERLNFETTGDTILIK